MLVSHRTGFSSPTMAARPMATTDNFCGGRLKVHVLVAGNDEDQRRDGAWEDHRTRRDARAGRGFDAYADTIEYAKELIPLLRSEVAGRDAVANRA